MARIGIDIDCTLNLFHRDFAEYIKQTHPELPQFSEEDYLFKQFEEIFGTDTQSVIKLFDEYLISEEYLNSKPIEHSIDVIKRLSEQNELHVVTARHDAAIPHTKKWLEQFYGKAINNTYNVDHFLFNSKSEICKVKSIDLIVEDHPGQIKSLCENNIPTIYFSGAVSQETANKVLQMLPKGIPHARTWLEIENIIKNR